jgi:hypothetical protein
VSVLRQICCRLICISFTGVAKHDIPNHLLPEITLAPAPHSHNRGDALRN